MPNQKSTISNLNNVNSSEIDNKISDNLTYDSSKNCASHCSDNLYQSSLSSSDYEKDKKYMALFEKILSLEKQLEEIKKELTNCI